MVQTYYKTRIDQTLKNLDKIKDTLPDFCDKFFIGIQGRTSPLTRLGYAFDLKIFFDFLIKKEICKKSEVKELTLKDIDGITAFDLEFFLDYLNSFEYNEKSLQNGECGKERKLSAVRAFVRYFYKKDLLKQDIGSKVSSVRVKQKNIVKLEIDEVVKLLDMVELGTYSVSNHQKKYLEKCKFRDLAILTLFLGTGIRVSELVGIDEKDIDFENNSFCIVRKGGNKTILYFNEEIANTLKQYKSWKVKNFDNTEQKAFFISMRGTRLCVRAIENMVKKYSLLVAPLKKISPHKLRTTFGTNLYKETQDIYAVAEVLGHKDVNTTKKHYAEISEEIKRLAIQKIKLRDKNK
ncbi:MAG: tyrosine-type recombinase/integrase [Clostridiales bacterium]|jgi:site-specific recombinase XerD|nr:tyrosine-type recombinase/integrase [Clostridiales bacterium]